MLTLLPLLLTALVGCTGGGTVPPGPSGTAGTPGTTATTTTTTTTGSPVIDWPDPVVTPFRTVAAGSATGVRIGLVSPDAADPFSRAVTDSIATAAGTAGAQLIRCDPGQDGEFAFECARRMATQRVDGWIVQRSGWQFGDSLCAAGPVRAPMVVVNGPPGRCTTATVGADDAVVGRSLGSELGSWAAERADCRPDAVIVLTDPGTDQAVATTATSTPPSTGTAPSTSAATGTAPSGTETTTSSTPVDPLAVSVRADAFRAGLLAMCPGALTPRPAPTTASTSTAPTTTGETTRTSEPTTDTTTAGRTERSTGTATSTATTGEPELVDPLVVIDDPDQRSVYDSVTRALGRLPGRHHVLIAALGDGPALTAVQAVRAAGRTDDVHLGAIGGDQRSRCELWQNPRWIGDVALFPDRYGELVVPSLLDAIAGRTVPKAMTTAPVFLTGSSVGRYYDVSGCTAATTTSTPATTGTTGTTG